MKSEPTLFASTFMAGFECSYHRLPTGRRLDMTAATGHDRFAVQDYARLQRQGIAAAREGVRWTLVEPSPGRYDFASLLPQVRAAKAAGIQVIWDLCHFGWPDHVDVFRPEFVRRFAAYARAVATVLAGETDQTPFYAPINEISFLSWAGGDVAYMNPFANGRGFELKAQLVRATVEGIEAVWDVDPRARIVHTDPIINVVPDPAKPDDAPAAEGHRRAQYEAWDMIGGFMWPGLGGSEKYLDILGVNYYPNNQWIHNGPRLQRTDALYRPLHGMLAEVYGRYGRPLFIAETGTEGDERPGWLAYIGGEVRAAQAAGVPVEAICWYPILNHPGWDDDRHCPNGLWDYADEVGERALFVPLAQEMRRQRAAASMSVSANGDGSQAHPSGITVLEPDASSSVLPDLVCFSHLRWDFVTQRPQHLLRRAARERRVYYVEEAIRDHPIPALNVSQREGGVYVVIPELPGGLSPDYEAHMLRRLLDGFFAEQQITRFVAWYYTPAALPFTRHLEPVVRVYDCMDELSLFHGAARNLKLLEMELLACSDLVFTGGQSLYEARRALHPNVHCFPSSIEREHFAQARSWAVEPPDQAAIPHPRLGYFGVIDERMDLELLDALAAARSDWQLVLIGPVTKIDPALLPRRANIHYLGGKAYAELPAYLSGWDVALLPFAINGSTRYISPTKTPEYLAGGRRVVSTPIRDVVRPYGDLGLVRIAATPPEFIAAVAATLAEDVKDPAWLAKVDEFLAHNSWDQTWAAMARLLQGSAEAE